MSHYLSHLVGLPNVLLTLLAESYLQAPLNVIPLAQTSHHLYRVLRSYRCTHPVTYWLFLHPRTHSVHIVTSNPESGEFDLATSSIIHWKSIPPEICDWRPWLSELTWKMKSKSHSKTKTKAKKKRQQAQHKRHRFMTHAQKATGLMTDGMRGIRVAEKKCEAISVASLSDIDPIFTPGRIGVCIPRHIILQRQLSRWPYIYFHRDGHLLDYNRESEQTFPDLMWLPHQCETLIIGPNIEPTYGMMTRLTHVTRIEFWGIHWLPTPTRENALLQFYPPNLTTLILKDLHPDAILPFAFPPTLTEITLPSYLLSSDQLDPNITPWPKGLTKLDYHGHMHTLQGWQLSNTVTDLSLGEYFNHSVAGWTPPRNLTRLVFREKFNHSLSDIAWHPSSVGLIELELGQKWQHPLVHEKLPATLKRLKLLSKGAEHVVSEFILPPLLEELTFGGKWRGYFNDLTLPSSLTRLHFVCGFNQPLLELTFPASLTDLKLGDDFSHQSIDGQQLVLNEGLRYLSFGSSFDEPVAELRLPSTLQSLTFGKKFNRDISALRLPDGLRTLVFDEKFSQRLSRVTLPSSLTHLTLGGEYNKTFYGVVLPSSLRQFHLLSNRFEPLDSLIELTFPETIERITLPHPSDLLNFPIYNTYLAYVDAFSSSRIVKLWWNPRM